MSTNSLPLYAALVPECARWGIGKTKAFELCRNKTLESFKIGRKRYVMIESLAKLPGRLLELKDAGHE